MRDTGKYRIQYYSTLLTTSSQTIVNKRERERRFIVHDTTIPAAVKTDSIKTQSGGLPEKHKAHLSWPPIVTITITQNQFTAKCKVQGAKGHKCAQISNASSYCC